MSERKPQAYKVVSREDVIAALDAGYIPAVPVFTDDQNKEIGTGNIILIAPQETVRKIEGP